MFSRRRSILALLSLAANALVLSTSGDACAEPASTSEEVAEDAPAPCSPVPPEDERVPVSVAFLYPLATNANRVNTITSADLSILYGRVGKIEGLQLGGVIVQSSRSVEGLQLGGVGTITGGPVKGAQVGGVVNVSGGSTTGVQLSGTANVARGDVTGAQLSPVNVAGPVEGLQLGVVNVGRRVRGLQLGLVNIAEEVDGAALGLVSISRNSVHPIVWTSNLQYTNAGVKFTTKYVFTTLAAHFGTHEADFDNVGATLALGGHVPLPEDFDVEVQGSFTQLAPWPNQSESRHNSWIAPQVVAGYSFAPHLRAFAGAGARLPLSVQLGRDVSRPELLAGLQF